MSFSSEIKEELSKLPTLANKDSVKAELIGYLITANTSIQQKGNKRKIRFSTENEYNINRFGKLLNNLEQRDYQIELQGRNYVITAPLFPIGGVSINIEGENQTVIFPHRIPLEEIEEKAMVRGTFLGGGSINNPRNNYHLEVAFKEKENAIHILLLLQKYHIEVKLLDKKNGCSIYSKDGEEISKFLAFIGANKGVLKFEDIRVYRDMRNNVNRIVNCETANLTKTVNAAIEQIEAIEYLKKTGKFAQLSDILQEIAEVRLANPESSLVEIGNMLKIPVGKSGANYRLKTIVKIAREIRN